MSTRSRVLVAALSGMLVALTTLSVDGVAVASAHTAGAAAARDSTAPAVSADRLGLGSDEALPHRAGRTAKVRKWNVRTLYYYDALPSRWSWSLSTAVGEWNSAGGHIKLARTTVARRAQVRVGYANIGSVAGQATVGAATHAFVHLSSRFRTMDALNARNRVTIMNVLAHELGHVLGFQHTTARCSLMSPTVDVSACNILPATQPGYYKCRTLDTPLVQHFIRLYGGRARYPTTTWCLIDPLPQALTGVSFSGGTNSPVAVHWNRPTSYPGGSSLVLKRWASSSCGRAPSWAVTYRPSLGSTTWQDQATYDNETDCFQVQLLNRYGAGRPAVSRVLERWVPALDTPVIGVPSYDSGSGLFSFATTLPTGATLRARWDTTHPSTCVTSPTDGTDVAFASVATGHVSLPAPDALPQCVSFFAVDQEHDRVSAPAYVTLDAAEAHVPAAPVVEDASWDSARAAFLAPATYPAGTHLVYDLSDDPETCPGDYTGGQAVTEDPTWVRASSGSRRRSPTSASPSTPWTMPRASPATRPAWWCTHPCRARRRTWARSRCSRKTSTRGGRPSSPAWGRGTTSATRSSTARVLRWLLR